MGAPVDGAEIGHDLRRKMGARPTRAEDPQVVVAARETVTNSADVLAVTAGRIFERQPGLRTIPVTGARTEGVQGCRRRTRQATGRPRRMPFRPASSGSVNPLLRRELR